MSGHRGAWARLAARSAVSWISSAVDKFEVEIGVTKPGSPVVLGLSRRKTT